MANIIFMGTPDFAKESLKCLFEAGHNIMAVVTNPDKPKGRGMKLAISPVKEYAISKKLNILQPEKVRKNEEFIRHIESMKPEYICVVAYGKILPKELIEIPTKGSINVHGSLLPKYRGAAPIQWAVLNGDKETGITTMYMDEGMDTGDMILKETVQIGENETTGELWEKLAKVGGKLLVETIKQIEEGTAPRIKQEGNFSMAPMLSKEMAKIDWENTNTVQIKNLVRGLNPMMGAYTIINNKKIKIWKAEIADINLEFLKDANNYKPGEIVYANEKHGLFIKTKDGVLSVLELQPENSKRMAFGDFLRGNKL